ncbi:hypothetical protein BJF85_13340 [Saccharomonospora sp. CUA-673]|uniref:GNAT family N-acetyltransferase n=1 Tax=Saccharomonospora sp. CUA-673 TaxID=1904969 RepID=UPI000965B3E3|nr:GNAT family N-acetyltransferase [Saccharomonospora sp. CUA-673]OLT48211.1 hypothetical protein BJF85_13340 [Saccharomonospora sp. CUA-673]
MAPVSGTSPVPAPPLLRTDRLLLRPLTSGDTAHIVALHTDPDVMRHLGPPAQSGSATDVVAREEVPRMVAAGTNHTDPDGRRQLPHYLAAETRDGGRFLGWFLLRPVTDSPLLPRRSPASLELGYRLARAAWGHGYATEGARALVHAAFTEAGADRVVATTMAVNTASRRVLEKCGLRLVRTFFPVWDEPLEGAEHGDVEYGLTRAEWTRSMKGAQATASDRRSVPEQ